MAKKQSKPVKEKQADTEKLLQAEAEFFEEINSLEKKYCVLSRKKVSAENCELCIKMKMSNFKTIAQCRKFNIKDYPDAGCRNC